MCIYGCAASKMFIFLLLQFSPEEEEKKRVRRERNKMAAAKCRNRRRELTDTLQAVSIPPVFASSNSSSAKCRCSVYEKQSDRSSLCSNRKPTSLRMRNPQYKMTSPSCSKRKRGWSSSSPRTSPSARFPPRWPSAFQRSRFLSSPPIRSLRFTASLPLECQRNTNPSQPLPVPRCFPARPPPTASTPR